MNINYNMLLEHKQIMAQAQIQSLEILSLGNVELDAFLQNEYLENPLFEHISCKETQENVDEYHTWYEKNQSTSYYDQMESDENEQNNGIAVVEYNEINKYLKSQLVLNRYSQEELKIIDFLLDCLDDSGFFTTPVMEIAELINVKVEKVEKCLFDLQQLEPFGIFAVDLAHCLWRQLEVLGVEDEVLKEIIMKHLPDVSEGKISRISRELGLSSLQVRKYIAFIMKLNPRPLAGFQNEKTSYIVPDIIFSYQDREWKINLNDNWMGNYRLNDYYLKMMNEAKDQDLFEYFKVKLERARFIMNSIEQRRKTLIGISETVLSLQQKFFLGKEEAKPMIMSDVANSLGIHVSTVSRAIKGKYIQYPHGTILLKSLFAAAVTNDMNDEVKTAEQIKTIIKKLIDQENKKKPYSDQALMNLLKEKEINISRRAIAKYREELGIKGSFERRDF